MGFSRLAFLLAFLGAVACGGGSEEDTGADAGPVDLGSDASLDLGIDGGLDAQPLDLGPDASPDAEPTDLGPDGGPDAEPGDLGPDGGPDADPEDLGADGGEDTGPKDTGPADTGPEDTGVADDGGLLDTGTPPDSGADSGVDLGIDAGADAGPNDAGTPTLNLDWSWSRHSTGPQRMFGHRVEGYDGHLFILGGRAPQCLGSNLSYDAYDDRYSNAPGHSLIQRGVLAWDGTRLLGGGGLDCGLLADPVFELFLWDPATDAFTDVSGPYSVQAVAIHSGGYLAQVDHPTAPQFQDWMRLDRTTLTWSPATRVGFPLFASPDLLLGLGDRVLYYASPTLALVYDPVADQWTPITPPPVNFASFPAAVAIGAEAFFWDGTLGARYDVISDSWTPISLVGAPTGTSPAVVWTGSEVVVLDDTGGGHYDPDTDTWRAIQANNRFWPALTQYSQRAVAWTGEEIIIYGGQLGSGRYGPRPLPNPTCAVPNAEVRLDITEPRATRVRNLGEQQPVAVTIDSNFSVQAIEWTLDGAPVLSGPSGTVDLTGLSYGPHQLQVRVEDVLGNQTCDDRILYVDRAPVLSVVSPVPYQLSSTSLSLRVSCTEDGGPCPITVRIGPLTLQGTDLLNTTLDVSAFDHSLQIVTIDGTDARGLTTRQQIPVHIESNPATTNTYFLGGPICHVRGRRALFVRDEQFLARDLSTGVESPITIVSANPPECSTARLLDGDGAVLDYNPGSALFYWDAGATQLQWVGSGLQVQSPWALSRSGQLQLRELGPNTVVDLGNTSIAAQTFLSSAGAVWFGTSAGELHRYVPGGADTVITSWTVPANPYLRGTPTQAIWREGSGNSWSIRRHDGAQVTTIAGPSSAWGSSGPGPQDLAAAGDYLAYTRPDALGTLQVWLQGAAGAPQIATGFGDATRIAGLDEEGDLTYRRAGRTWHRQRSTGLHTDVASDQAVVHAEGTVLWLVDGDRILRVP
jgi:hypothetical protein